MASARDVIVNQLETGQQLLEMFTSDLSDAEYFTPPTQGANHAGWILGHIACSEDWAVSLITGSDQRIPQATHELFKGGSACLPDASRYPSRRELDELFRNTRACTMEAVKAFDESKWNDPTPERGPREFFPTLGSMWNMQGTHPFWHIGQLSVCRKALNKKPLLM